MMFKTVPIQEPISTALAVLSESLAKGHTLEESQANAHLAKLEINQQMDDRHRAATILSSRKSYLISTLTALQSIEEQTSIVKQLGSDAYSSVGEELKNQADEASDLPEMIDQLKTKLKNIIASDLADIHALS